MRPFVGWPINIGSRSIPRSFSRSQSFFPREPGFPYQRELGSLDGVSETVTSFFYRGVFVGREADLALMGQEGQELVLPEGVPLVTDQHLENQHL